MYSEVAIIGAGPAGMAAALQLKRSGIEFLLFEKNELGGLLKNAWRVENYLGFAKAKSGLELLHSFQQHLKQYAIEPIITEVKNVNYEEKKCLFIIKTDTSIYYAKYLVVASGTKPKQLRTKNVLYEIFPLLQEQNKTITIIGAGDAAFDFALNLAEQNKVFIINRQHVIKALPLLVKKAFQNKNIIYKENYRLKQIIKAETKKLLCIFTDNRNNFKIQTDYLVAAIGRVPQKDFYAKNFYEYEAKLIAKGILYLVGDVQGQIHRQVSIASASGIKAAMQIKENLKSLL